MANKVYVGDTGLAVLADCGRDLTGAEDITLEVTKPDGTLVSWAGEVATISGAANYVVHYTAEGDLDLAGKYKVQPKFSLGTWEGLGETATLKVYARFK